MFSPPGGRSKSSGRSTFTRSGLTITDAELSTVSAVALSATQHPEKRDIAQPWMPKSRYSWTVDGLSTGIIADANMCSL